MRAARSGEVVVVGGGVAGCSVALGLRKAGVRAVVVQAPVRGRWRPGETLPPAARPHLQALGVWEQFVADGHLPVAGNRSAWGASEPAERDFLFDPHGPGWHLHRARFDAMLAAAARAAGARWMTARPAAVRAGEGGEWAVDVGGEVMRTGVVMDASGRGSWLGRACGGRRRVVDRLVGLVAVVGGGTRASDDPRTLVEAAPTGWWYSAEVPGGQLVVAHMTDPDLLPPGTGKADLGIWVDLLADAPLTAARIGAEPGFVARPRVVAAGSSVLVPPAGPGWLAVGDAAATHDPLSSQGMVTALASGRAAAAAVVAALDGDDEALRRHAASVVTDYARYLSMRAGYYALEQRWPRSPFWQRRHRLVADAAPSPPSPPRDRQLVSSVALPGRHGTGGLR